MSMVGTPTKKVREMGQRRAWHKNLYESQGYPDNYTDISFLEELKKNVNVRKVTFPEAFLGSVQLTLQLSIVVFFGLNFFCMYNGLVSSSIMFLLSSVLTLVGYGIYSTAAHVCLKRHSKGLAAFLSLGYLLSPVLKTLTETISTDTIYAMSATMMLIHLVFYDYGVRVVIVSSSLSLNAAVFACLCLASRLSSPFDSFVLMSSAVQCFLLAPLFLSKVPYLVHFTLFLTCLCFYGLFVISSTLSVLFLLTILFVNFLCPYLFVRWHAYKDNIYGPWDEAVIPGAGQPTPSKKRTKSAGPTKAKKLKPTQSPEVSSTPEQDDLVLQHMVFTAILNNKKMALLDSEILTQILKKKLENRS